MTGSKEERRHFLLMNFMVVTAMALWFEAILNIAHVIRMNTIKHGSNAAS